MQSVIGNTVTLSLFGESHGEAVGAVLDSIAPGIRLDPEFMTSQMEKRKPKGNISTQRREEDKVKIVSGLFNGYTTGTPLCILIENSAQLSGDYEKNRDIMRPSHADYAAEEKYLGYQDYRGGGHFSGRLTAPLVAAGAICLQILKSKGIEIGSHIIRCKDEEERLFSSDETVLREEIRAVNGKYFPTVTEDAEKRMVRTIEEARAMLDSVGGVIESAVAGMPAGIGEPYFHSVESVLAHLIFSVPAVKGIEFGGGFQMAELYGSQANDSFYYEGGKVKTATNHAGGLNGGVTNAMPLLIRTAVKPTPSIYKEQNSVNIRTKENVKLAIAGRHDPAIIHRARVVIDSVIAFGLVDLLSARYGYLWQRP